MFKPIKEKLKGSSEISPPREVDEDDQAQSPDVKVRKIVYEQYENIIHKPY